MRLGFQESHDVWLLLLRQQSCLQWDLKSFQEGRKPLIEVNLKSTSLLVGMVLGMIYNQLHELNCP